jgi:hypothetical protein
MNNQATKKPRRMKDGIQQKQTERTKQEQGQGGIFQRKSLISHLTLRNEMV